MSLSRNLTISLTSILLLFTLDFTVTEAQEQATILDYSDAITALITTAGAVGGGITGAYFTYRNATKIEDRKDERELKKQKEYNQDMKRLIRHELKGCKDSLKAIHDLNLAFIESYPRLKNIRDSIVFTRLPVEQKLQVMDPEPLAIIGLAYAKFLNVVDLVELVFDKQRRGTIVEQDYDRASSGLDNLIPEFMRAFDAATNLIDYAISVDKSIDKLKL